MEKGLEPPLVVVVGPTASGKSAVALEVAERFSGEIICSDSRTIYKGMDIGTAKPTAEDRTRVPHWGLDLVEPGEKFTAADFQKDATQKIKEIRARGNIPFLVGGTGLYVDAILFDFQFPKVDENRRQMLSLESLESLHDYCTNNNIEFPENDKNKRHIINAILRHESSQRPQQRREPVPNTIVVGIATESQKLKQRIAQRSAELFNRGMIDEAKKLGEKYGWESEAMTGNIYRLVHQFLNNEFDETELRARFVTADWQLAKRQMTWLKRNTYIQWVSREEAPKYIQERILEVS